MKALKSFLLFLSLNLLACTRNPSILLNPAGPHAAKIESLFWYVFWVEVIVWILVLGVLFRSLARRKTEKIEQPLELSERTERRLTLFVGTAIAMTVLILTSIVGFSYLVDKKLIELDQNPTLEIEVTAHQWWWELRYMDKPASKIFLTANEIHIPIHEKVKLILKSTDVIHSLWIPNLSGKKDIIPGREQDLVIEANQEGVWKGRCAEFCGMQHAKMDLIVIAESKEKFEAWKESQLQPAKEPQDPEEIRGMKIFTSISCTMCHVIRGTEAKGYSSHAPDLTHLKSRTHIGSGAATNTKGNLGGWIIDPQRIKPGVHMPTMLQEPRDFQALLNYLETLK
jgi:cytochrome c oxidase subunit 2